MTGRQRDLIWLTTAIAVALHAVVAEAFIVQQQFQGLASSDDTNLIGGIPIPPDSILAVGPNHIFQMVNNVGRITDKSGTAISPPFTLSMFFQVDTGDSIATDPQVLYDASSGRWFATYLQGTTSGPSDVILAVSTSSDPTQSFCRYRLSRAFFQDQPKIGVSDDKFVITYNGFTKEGTGSFLGAGYYVLNKADLVACASTMRLVSVAPDPGKASIQPAQSLTSTSNLYMVMHPSMAESVTLFTIQGLPSAGNVTVSSVGIVLSTGWTPPPHAVQPGMSPTLDTGDDRVQSASWMNNSLWFAGNESCVPEGDFAPRSCARVVEIRTDTGTLHQDNYFRLANSYYFYPALRHDYAGNVGLVFTRSSSTEYASVRVSARSAMDALNTFQSSVQVAAGGGSQTDSSRRMGDYSGAAVDPTDGLTVWVIGEYIRTTASRNWGTYVSQLAINNPVPSLSGLSPSSAIAGGAAFILTVSGGNFASGATVQWNGSNRMTTFVSSGQLQATIQTTDIATGGAALVSVLNPTPGGGGSNALTFTIVPTFALSVVKAGSGGGTVTSSPSGINCGVSCSGQFASGTSVVLTASPDSVSMFAGWSGCDSVAGAQCTVVVTATRTATATFQPMPLRLSITKAGTGGGVVTSATGISCGGVCSQVLNAGSMVTLTATPGPGSTFTGWSGGGCSGTGSCTVTLTTTTTFAGGTGGGCSGSGSCTVILLPTTIVTATFTAPPGQFGLSVVVRGSAGGTVVSSPPGISCGSTCSQVYGSGAMVTLTASPAAGASFKAWSGGGCNGTGSCVVTISTMQSVSATFSAGYTDPNPTPTVSIIMAVDVTELRSAVNKLRAQNLGLSAFGFTDPTIVVGVTPVRTVHVTELRTALSDAYTQAGVTAPSYSDPILTPDVTTIKAADLNELRSAVGALE